MEKTMKQKKKFLSLFLALALVLSLAPAASAKTSPYFIRVNRATCTVTIYATNSAGKRVEPLKAMICSVGKVERGTTPLGTYTLTAYRPLWCKMKDGSYGQYISQFRGNYLFHSVCYRQKDPSTLIPEEYNDLGQPASLGCVRLQTADAKWIFENCPAGTVVEIFDGSASDDPLGKPDKQVDYLDPTDPDSGWDPTDPRKENPWHDRFSIPSTTSPSTMPVELDGKQVFFQCYALKDKNGNPTNYIKLRDLALLLNESDAQFSVSWDKDTRSISLTSGEAYIPDGSENSTPYSGEQPCAPSAATLMINGKEVNLDSFTLDNGGSTYFRLRDLGNALDFNVGWRPAKGMFVETGRAYDPND